MKIKKSSNQTSDIDADLITVNNFFAHFVKEVSVNFPTKIDYRIKFHLEKDMKKLFKSRKVLAAAADIPSPDAKIIFTKAPFVQYEQILLDKNFRQYLETIMVSKKILRTGTQKHHCKKHTK